MSMMMCLGIFLFVCLSSTPFFTFLFFFSLNLLNDQEDLAKDKLHLFCAQIKINLFSFRITQFDYTFFTADFTDLRISLMQYQIHTLHTTTHTKLETQIISFSLFAFQCNGRWTPKERKRILLFFFYFFLFNTHAYTRTYAHP